MTFRLSPLFLNTLVLPETRLETPELRVTPAQLSATTSLLAILNVAKNMVWKIRINSFFKLDAAITVI